MASIDDTFNRLRRPSRTELDIELEMKFWRTGITGTHVFYSHPAVVAYIEQSGWKYDEFKEVMMTECAVGSSNFL